MIVVAVAKASQSLGCDCSVLMGIRPVQKQAASYQCLTKKLREQKDEKFQKDWIKLKDYINKKWKGKNLSLNLERY